VTQAIKLGIVDDHEAVRIGLAAAAAVDARTAAVPVVVMGMADTVESLLVGGEGMFDVVALDMSLADGSRPGENVRRIVEAGCPVLVFSVGDRADELREALAAGASGVARKSELMQHTLGLIRAVASGETVDNQDLAAAIDGDPKFSRNMLSEREKETLKHYAAGRIRKQIARDMNISENTVATNLKRIREKYEAAGRYAPTKIDLRRRAVEDGLVEGDSA
jgi:DNA-binding NarL/FixJ family response regulator